MRAVGLMEMDQAQECIDQLLAGVPDDDVRWVIEQRWAHHVEEAAQALPHEDMRWYWWQMHCWMEQLR